MTDEEYQIYELPERYLSMSKRELLDVLHQIGIELRFMETTADARQFTINMSELLDVENTLH